jgi:hypothetical protein
MAELDSVYNPQRDVYSKQINALPGQQSAELGGLEAAKTDSFNQITQGANRRGVAFGGIPLAEQASYLGQSYLPAVANLKGKFQGQKSDLQLRLAELAAKQRGDAQGIYQWEMEQDRAAQAAAAARAGSGGSGGGGFTFGGGGFTGGGGTGETQPQITLRQQWQQEANAGDWNAQVALNYAGDDGRYDGAVNSQREYQALKNLGIQGNYYVPSNYGGSGLSIQSTGGNGGLSVQGGGSIPKPVSTNGLSLRL